MVDTKVINLWAGPVSDISLEAMCRKITLCSILYYGLNATSPLTDSEYDEMSNHIADHWDELPEVWQWKMGSAEDIRATGFHIKCSLLDLDGTAAYDKSVNGWGGGHVMDRQVLRRFSKKFGFRYGPPDSIRRA
jgi:hypothetical protein